jgi:hypothetical protein
MRHLGWRELQVVAARLLGELPTGESQTVVARDVMPITVTGNGTARRRNAPPLAEAVGVGTPIWGQRRQAGFEPGAVAGPRVR